MIDEAASFEAAVPLTQLQRISLRTYYLIESLSTKILWLLEHRSKSSRLFIGCIIGLLCMFSLRHAAHAQNAPAGATHLLQNEIDIAYDVAFQFDLLGNAITLAQIIFSSLAGITVIVNVLAYYIRNQSVKGLGQVVLSSVLRLGVPFVIIGLAPTVLPSISLTGLQIASDLTGNGTPYGSVQYIDAPPPSAISLVISDLYNNTFGMINNNQSNVTITPSNIATFGENIGFTIIDKAECAVDGGKFDAGAANDPCTPGPTSPGNQTKTYDADNQVMQTIVVLAIGIIGTFVFIAVELVIAYLQIYLVLPVAAFSLGFLGSPATRQYGAGYWSVVVSALLKFVTIVFTIGFAITVANTWASALGNYNFPSPTNTKGTTNVGALKVAIGYSMAAFSLLYIVRVVPSLFAGLLNGNGGSGEGNQAEYQGQGIGGRFVGGTGGRNPNQTATPPLSQTSTPRGSN